MSLTAADYVNLFFIVCGHTDMAHIRTKARVGVEGS